MTRPVIVGILLLCTVAGIHAQSGRQPASTQKNKAPKSEPQKQRDDVVVVDTDLVVRRNQGL